MLQQAEILPKDLPEREILMIQPQNEEEEDNERKI